VTGTATPVSSSGLGRQTMLAETYSSFKKAQDANGIIFSFSGYVSEGILYSLGEALRQKMALEEADTGTVKRVFSIFVEQVQNIIRYSADKVSGSLDREVELSAGMVTIGIERGRFFIVCGNAVRETEAAKLEARLRHLRGLDKDGIKAYYREQLRAAPDDDSRGATIGLIEIARRASEPIEYDFAPAGDGRVFFCLKACI
jgi:hypothetical protein